ncbi:MAG: tRNA (N(6)-L-threonylcarbamoyladenosine(37)-C(2))-methylthiotransferase MtaB [Deltaproteobacteria bacterium]|nr:tRNA (N(6)-L-threonylcarbamoyladenosine(37)-C(2))-methylthiotransferase MtaB [Deltaproteobacteria bacterium]
MGTASWAAPGSRAACRAPEENCMPRCRFVTFGCKVNQCDTAALALALGLRGWVETRPGEAPDLVVVNTCTVTARADQQARQAIRRAARESPGAALWVTGCYAQRAPGELAALPGVAGVVGNFDKASLPRLMETRSLAQVVAVQGHAGGQRQTWPDIPPTSFSGRTRAFLKVQDGCSHSCSYCVVPQVRGPARSLGPPELVAAHLHALASQGCREVVLTGVDLGQYGSDQGADLAGLLRRLADRPPPGRLRLSSLEPQEVTADLLAAWAELPGACRHFHLPLQSGSAEVLRDMARPYAPADFRELVMEIRGVFPQAAIGLDLLVGFPTETRSHFEETVALVEALPVAYLHVFPFSPRPGTPAAALQPLPPAEVRARASRLRELGKRKRQRFIQDQVGGMADVLVEGGSGRRGWLQGLSSNYLRVLLPGPPTWRNRRLRVRLTGGDGVLARGEPLEG